MRLGKKAGKAYEMDMCSGPLFSKLVVFAVPLILSGILQLLFNAADIIVVGKYAGHESLAAVGSTSALINLLVNVFIGLSVGANVLVAQYFGAHRMKDLEETVHTAMVLAVGGGLFLVVLGVLLADPLNGDAPGCFAFVCSLYEDIFCGDAGHSGLQFRKRHSAGCGRYKETFVFSAVCRDYQCTA